MYRKALIGGVTAAAILGAGGTAMAVTGSDSATPGQPSTSTSATAGHHKGDHKGQGKDKGLLRRLEHGQFVVRGKDGKSTTIDMIRGTVTAVSSTSITVEAKDKTSETFAVTSKTKVHERQAGVKGKAAKATIAAVAKGDHALVTGTGSSTYTANRIQDVKGKK